MNGLLKNTEIRGIATAVPVYAEQNIEAAPFLGERRCKKQIKITGVKQRYVSPSGQRISDLCYVAAAKLINYLKWDSEDIKVLVLLTQNPNYKAPSTAFLLHKMLGLSADAIVFDVNLGCSAFNVGLQIVSSLLQQIPGDAKGVCLQGDLAFRTVSETIAPDNMASNLLFGSAGSAVAIEKKNVYTDIPFATYSDGNRYQAILCQLGGAVSMAGQEVFNFSTNDVCTAINEFITDNNLAESEIDYYVLHQAQKLILDEIAYTCNIPAEKELRSIEMFGNTSGASVPLSLCANKYKFNGKKYINTITCGFGVGLSWSMAYSRLATQNILPVIYTDEIFER